MCAPASTRERRSWNEGPVGTTWRASGSDASASVGVPRTAALDEED
jgi:hypothetical protein